MAIKKKDFSSAADAFLGAQLPKQDTLAEVAEVKPTEAEIKTEQTQDETIAAKKELKTKSVLLKLTPSLHEKIRLAAEKQGLSFNAYVTTSLINTIK